MTNTSSPDSRQPDDRLATFTDRLLDGDMDALAGMDGQEQLDADEQTVARLWAAFGRQEPNPALASRIRDSLAAEWRARSVSAGQPLWRRWRWMPAALLATGAAVVVIVVLVSNPSGGALPGAAAGNSGLVAAVILLGAALTALAWWIGRRG
jgi:hypothetical protein